MHGECSNVQLETKLVDHSDPLSLYAPLAGRSSKVRPLWFQAYSSRREDYACHLGVWKIGHVFCLHHQYCFYQYTLSYSMKVLTK